MLENILLVKPENRFEFGCKLSRLIPQHGVHGRGIDNLVGVENMVWIPGIFHLLQQPIVLLAYHLLDELSTQSPITMLTTQ